MSAMTDFEIENGILKKYKGPGGDVVIPEGVTSIGEEAFRGRSRLTSVTIPEGVTSIEKEAFEYCSSLTSVTIPESVECIRDRAFSHCGIDRVVIPNSCGLGSGVFSVCCSVRLAEVKTKKRMPYSIAEYLKGTDYAPDELAWLLSYQYRTGSNWKEFIKNSINGNNAAEVFQALMDILQNEKKISKTLGLFICELAAQSLEKDEPVLKELRDYLERKNCPEAAEQMSILVGKEDYTTKAHTAEKIALANREYNELTTRLLNAVPSGIRYSDSEEICAKETLVYVIQSYAEQMKGFPSNLLRKDGFISIKMIPKADAVAEMLNYEDLTAVLIALSGKPGFASVNIALGRYARGRELPLIISAINTMSTYKSSDGEKKRAILMRSGLMLNDAREAVLYFDKIGRLAEYSALRGETEDEMRDSFLSDFGFDENGVKRYDLGGAVIEARLTNKLKIELTDSSTGKAIRSVPSKNVDAIKAELAKTDIADIRRNVKATAKNRAGKLFEAFLSGTGIEAKRWKELYLGNPVLRTVAMLLVWSQEGRTFTISDTGIVDSTGREAVISEEVPILVAHPIELTDDELEAWRKYFTSKGISQPFEQIWEPAYEGNLISSDRYEGARVPLKYLKYIQRHGIKAWYYSWNIVSAGGTEEGLELKDCTLDYSVLDDDYDPDDETKTIFTLGKFAFPKYTRQVNHIVYILDRITAYERVKKDDVTVEPLLSSFTLAQIMEFIALATENNCPNVAALLLQYKNTHFADFNPMDEFTLDLL